MDFDRFSVVLLVDGPADTRPPAGDPDPLQDDHLAYLARLSSEGRLLAAGPCSVPGRPEVRGLSLFAVDAAAARALAEADPAVVAGRFAIEVVSWMVPAGVIAAGTGHLPRSMAEVIGDG